MTEETSATERRDETDRVHKRDVFREGDRYPWKGETAVVTGTETVTELPDPISDQMIPVAEDGTVYVLVTLSLPDTSDAETAEAPASFLAKRLDYHPDDRAPLDLHTRVEA